MAERQLMWLAWQYSEESTVEYMCYLLLGYHWASSDPFFYLRFGSSRVNLPCLQWGLAHGKKKEKKEEKREKEKE